MQALRPGKAVCTKAIPERADVQLRATGEAGGIVLHPNQYCPEHPAPPSEAPAPGCSPVPGIALRRAQPRNARGNGASCTSRDETRRSLPHVLSIPNSPAVDIILPTQAVNTVNGVVVAVVDDGAPLLVLEGQ